MARVLFSTLGIWLGGVLVLGTLLVGCGSARQRYLTLCFFFDGVPDPDAKAVQQAKASGARVFLHAPYADKKCDSCHENTEDIFARAKVRSDVCLKCHAPLLREYARMHGPVAAGECRMCHQAHLSANERLLKQPAPRLCVQCHESATLSTATPEHVQAQSNCLTCHSGHGGPDANQLKPAPATAPSSVVRGSLVSQ